MRTWAGHVSAEIDFTTPPFDDKRVRQALAFATPYEQLMRDGVLGLARPWQSPVKRMSQWYRPATRFYTHDPKRARELLSEARDGSGLVSDFYVILARADCRRMTEIIAAAWRA